SLSADVTTGPELGINATANMTNFRTGAVLLEASQMEIRQDSDAMRLNVRIENNSKRNPNRFTATLDGSLLSDGFNLMANFKDAKGREGINIGTRVILDGHGGMSFTLLPRVSTLAYRQFKINDDNFLRVDSAGFFTANIDLLADDNTNLKLFSLTNDSINQDITLSLANLNLHDLSSVVPFMPKVSGWLDGDIHVIKTPQSFTAVGQLQSRQLEYEGIYVGDIGTELFYMPEDDGHYVVAQILSMDKEVAVLDGHYYDRQDGILDATLTLDQFPVSLLNTFLSDDGTLALRGMANGEISVKGPTANLALNGQINPDSIHAYSELYGFDLAMENKPIAISQGKILFDQMKFLGRQSDNPLVVDGSVNLGNLSDIIYDLSIKATDFSLINAEKTKKSLLYGKVFVDIDATLKGKSGFMMLRGDLNVLGKTDMTYIMRDTPLQVDDQFSGLVEFVDFSDSGEQEEQPEETGGLFVSLNLNVDPATHLHCELSDDGKNYVDCNGGGNLKMMMFPGGDMSMTGRFNIQGGEMKYTLPFIPLKTFTFAEGNFIQFNGDIDNPTLNITATERTKAAVTGETDVSRMVVFDVGVKITKQLSNMGVEFLIDAPEDSEVQSELATMGNEMRNKVAVTMLATGLYMSSSNKTGFKANNALNSFLESEIQNIAGSALKTIDISVGVEGNTTASGETQTDYTFQFSKKFWNDRVTFVIGGKVTTGATDEGASSSQSFIDNISLEYRLNRLGTRYIQVFYDNDTYDPLEGSYSSAGAGYIWRRRTDSFGDLMLFRRSKKKNKE
ncbi:MAG: translocation/assembly module TamB domain-containing protein, partial [Bacteroidaceae bacterium]|nr:translocation/assembly module TamB domain-containing protein [Bacteroidaceae bacterium]